MTVRPVVVFDCNIYLQSMLNSRGPAAHCFQAFLRSELSLIVSPIVIAEIYALPTHPDLRRFPSISRSSVDELIATVLSGATLVSEAPTRFELPRDPDDAHYVNLALAAGASLIVSRDNDLLDLMNPARPDGREFLARFEHLRILRPDQLLEELRRDNPAHEGTPSPPHGA